MVQQCPNSEKDFLSTLKFRGISMALLEGILEERTTNRTYNQQNAQPTELCELDYIIVCNSCFRAYCICLCRLLAAAFRVAAPPPFVLPPPGALVPPGKSAPASSPHRACTKRWHHRRSLESRAMMNRGRSKYGWFSRISSSIRFLQSQL